VGTRTSGSVGGQGNGADRKTAAAPLAYPVADLLPAATPSPVAPAFIAFLRGSRALPNSSKHQLLLPRESRALEVTRSRASPSTRWRCTPFGENGVSQRGQGRAPLCFSHGYAVLLTSSLETKPALASIEQALAPAFVAYA
jgi:hypothetical protein